MDVDYFDFKLPDDRVAVRPAEPRGSARLLVVEPSSDPRSLTDASVADLRRWLSPGDALVFNDTKVVPAQLTGCRWRGASVARVSFTLHKRIAASRWLAFARGSKKLREGDLVEFGEIFANVLAKHADGSIELSFDIGDRDMEEVLEAIGSVPIPPYIAAKRSVDEHDEGNYQTVYADRAGAVAAPTAGLHFTDQLLDDLRAAGVHTYFVTLHVGAGTFLPVKADDTDDHLMHSEWGEIPTGVAKELQAAKSRGNKVVAVGTTSLRLLESAADEGRLRPWTGDTNIFITPGYKFQFVDALLTNFHLPRSTLFMLVSAFSGLERMRQAYEHAISAKYRFYSYGDATLLFPDPETAAPRPT